MVITLVGNLKREICLSLINLNNPEISEFIKDKTNVKVESSTEWSEMAISVVFSTQEKKHLSEQINPHLTCNVVKLRFAMWKTAESTH